MLKALLTTAQQQASKLLLRGVAPGGALVNLDHVRTTIIVRRKFPIALTQQGHKQKLKIRNYVYELVENEAMTKVPPLSVILTRTVEGLGSRGDLVTVKRSVARNHLLPDGQAVYASPENIAEFQKEKEDTGDDRPRQTPIGTLTVRQLKGMNLPIPMHPTNAWTLNRTHVKVAFRKIGVILPEDAITLPEEPVTEPQDIQVHVLVNGIDDIPISCFVFHYHADSSTAPAEWLEWYQTKRPPVWQMFSPMSKRLRQKREAETL